MYFMESIDRAGNSILHQGLAETQQVSEPPVGKPQVGEELLLVCIVESFHTLEFHDDLVFDEKVGLEIPPSFPSIPLAYLAPWREIKKRALKQRARHAAPPPSTGLVYHAPINLREPTNYPKFLPRKLIF